MKEGIKVRLTGKKDGLMELIRHIEKENIVIKDTDFMENDMDDGHHIFVRVLPRRVVQQ